VGKWGADAVFETDAIAPLALTKRLLPALKAKGEGCVVLVSSIALSLAKTDEADPDFRTRSSQMKAYGNAKRMLTAALLAFGKREGLGVALAHPGISATGITAGYPKAFRAVADLGMKLIFPAPKSACLSVARAAVCPPPVGSWLAPRVFGVWGMPAVRRLPISEEEWELALKILENMIYPPPVCCEMSK
jgi:NAD(P)-dependent dehydrogenase (short-subunit alcohol dehydrogenase family)